MILVDTSVWIELLAARKRYQVGEEDLLRFVTCGPIVQEVIQGLRPGPQSNAFRETFLGIPTIADPVDLRLYLAGAEIYRQGRQRSITIRSSVDCLIAAIAIDNNLPVWHQDRDFDAIAIYTPLQTKSS